MLLSEQHTFFVKLCVGTAEKELDVNVMYDVTPYIYSLSGAQANCRKKGNNLKSGDVHSRIPLG